MVHVDRLRPAHGERPSEPWYDPTAARREYNEAMKNVPVPLRGDYVDPVLPSLSEKIDDTVHSDLDDVTLNANPSIEEDLVMQRVDTVNDNQVIDHPFEEPLDKSIGNSPIIVSPLLPELSLSEDAKMSTSVSPPGNQDFFFRPTSPAATVSVQGRTQGLKGGNVNLKKADGLDAPEFNSPVRNIPASPDQDEDLMDIPVEIELRLKKTKIQKRKFVPSIKNNLKRKKAKQ
ncbi:hypothetical protein HPULCUR_008072 [Helicostylum pulchrum]|uniref:Uncharacterized protein n=1 Tax=Helicostylum pulchrum TaxID=562976 RepID=A0ABP9Y6M6_9FUNG